MKKKIIFGIVIVILLIIAYLFSQKDKTVVLPQPPEMTIIAENSKAQATCLLSSYSWTEKGKGASASYPAPWEREYDTNSTLKLSKNDILHLNNDNAKIISVSVYDATSHEEIENGAVIENDTIRLSVPEGEYYLNIRTEFKQGVVCYDIKVAV